MARQARIVIPGTPHHITQRGNRSQPVFFEKSDYCTYLDLLKEQAELAGVSIWAYCLLANQVHLIAVPSNEDGLRQALGEAHRRYTRMINARNDWRGHLWQERFFSYPMDHAHLLAAARYIEQLPVMMEIAPKPQSYLWSSARAHICGRDDSLLGTKPLLSLKPDWEDFIQSAPNTDDLDEIGRHLRTGRPRGGAAFLDDLESTLGRRVRPQKPGRPRKEVA